MAVLWLESKRLSGKRCISDHRLISSYNFDTVSREQVMRIKTIITYLSATIDEALTSLYLHKKKCMAVIRENSNYQLQLWTRNRTITGNFPFFSEFMIQTRVKLFRRILDTAIQWDVLFIFPREVRYCKAVFVSICGTVHRRNEANSEHSFPCYIIAPFPRAGLHGGEANSESTYFPGIFSHHSPYKYNYKHAIRMTDTTCWCRIFQLILKYYLSFCSTFLLHGTKQFEYGTLTKKVSVFSVFNSHS